LEIVKKLLYNDILEQAAYLHTGKGTKPNLNNSFFIENSLTIYIWTTKNLGLQLEKLNSAILTTKLQFLRNFVRFIGSNRAVSNITTIDLQNYRRKLIKTGKAAHTINNVIASIKAMYNWAMGNEVINNAPNLKAIKKVPIPKVEKPTF